MSPIPRVLPYLSDARCVLAPAATLPFIVRLTCADGSTPMYGTFFLPPAAQGEGVPRLPLRTIVYAYGGPGVQVVRNSCELRAGLKSYKKEVFERTRDVLVAMFDGRGSSNRGRAFDRTLRRAMGTVEVDDQAAGTAWLAARGLADASNVGIHGWSYGGYLTLRCMASSHPCFKVGVAGAPVTTWRLYDTCYTERYMAHPGPASADYDAAAVVLPDKTAAPAAGDAAVAALPALSTRPWQVIHGDLDENVLFEHSEQLIKAGYGDRVLSVPGERHAIRKFTRKIAEETVTFLLANLSSATATS